MKYFLFALVVLYFSCRHEPPHMFNQTNKATLNVTLPCNTCSSGPICAVADDIPVNSSSTYATCAPSPSGQGSFTFNQQNCLIWTPEPGASQVVNTCIIVCTDGVCDSTQIYIYPFGTSDTTSMGPPCVPGVIYFERDVLPILTANCAYSGCHNAQSASDGIILDTYDNVIRTGKIRPGNARDSKIFEAITEKDNDDIMPPPPSPALSPAQIKIISDWIMQGAKNDMCDEGTSGCDTIQVSFTQFIMPKLLSCTSCHRSGNASGGILLDSYQGVKAATQNGRLYGSVAWSAGYTPMPSGGVRWDDCSVKKLKSWIDSGSPDN